ncbi:MAG: serine hydrolase domain-containing protein [Candidatus Wallbacteria bacterium]
MKKFYILILCLSLIMCAAGVSDAKNLAKRAGINDEKYKNAITAARETLWKAITNGQGTGATVAIMDHGRIVYSEGIGVTDRSKNSPVDKYTRFNIGSTSKMFVVAAVMLLVDDGRVNLDEPMAKYIPEFTMRDPRYKDITVRMLFNHSSGLPGTTTITGYETCDDTHKILIDSMKRAMLKHKPGAMSMYCNDGFTFAEILVERVSGIKYMDFLNKRVFKPLCMHNTGASTGELNPENAALYYDAKGLKHPNEVMMVYGAGGLSSTAEDLCRFGYSFCDDANQLLSKNSLIEMRKTQPTEFSMKLRGPQMMQELGWEYVNNPYYGAKGVQVMSKGGNTTYNSTCLLVLPKEEISIGVIISGTASGETLARPVLEGILKDKNIAEPKPKEVEKPLEAQKVSEDMLNYEGYYVSDAKLVMLKFDSEKKGFSLYSTDAAEGSKDGIKSTETPIYTFIYNNGFFYDYKNKLKFYFVENDGVKYIAASHIDTYDVDMVMFQKLEPVKNPPAMKIDLNGKTWLFKNIKPYVTAGGIKPMHSNLIKDLPGYISFAGIKKIESADFASIAATAFRDQSELYLIENNGEIWAQASCFLLAPADKIKKVVSGINRIFIGLNNYNEWMKVEKGAILKFEAPEKGRIIVVKGDETLFDNYIDKNDELYTPEGSFIFFAGRTGDYFRIMAR